MRSFLDDEIRMVLLELVLGWQFRDDIIPILALGIARSVSPNGDIEEVLDRKAVRQARHRKDHPDHLLAIDATLAYYRLLRMSEIGKYQTTEY